MLLQHFAPAVERTWGRRSWASIAPTSGSPTASPVQMGWSKKDNQVRLAHLIREATNAVEAGETLSSLPALRKLLKRVHMGMFGSRANFSGA